MVDMALEMISMYLTIPDCSVVCSYILYKRCKQACTDLPNPSWMQPREGRGGTEAGRGGRGGGHTVLVRTYFHVVDGCDGPIHWVSCVLLG